VRSEILALADDLHRAVERSGLSIDSAKAALHVCEAELPQRIPERPDSQPALFDLVTGRPAPEAGI